MRARYVSLAVSAALVLGACGGGGTVATSEPTTTQAPSTTVAPTTTAPTTTTMPPTTTTSPAEAPCPEGEPLPDPYAIGFHDYPEGLDVGDRYACATISQVAPQVAAIEVRVVDLDDLKARLAGDPNIRYIERVGRGGPADP